MESDKKITSCTTTKCVLFVAFFLLKARGLLQFSIFPAYSFWWRNVFFFYPFLCIIKLLSIYKSRWKLGNNKEHGADTIQLMLLSYVSPCMNVPYITCVVLCVCTLEIFTSWLLLVLINLNQSVHLEITLLGNLRRAVLTCFSLYS